MLTQNEIEILSSFFPKLADLTAKEIETKTGLSHETTFRLLKKVVQEKHLKGKKIGKTNVYEFVKGDLTYQLFVHHVTKKKLAFKEKHLLIYKRLTEFINEVRPDGPVIIFGSYAKNTETKKSDIDLLCVTTKKNVGKLAQEFKTKYDLNIQVLTVKPSDFKNIKKDNPVFWNDLIEYGLVLDGLDYYFKEVYKHY
ncbi:nucleotidyltransferase domain-containing protein [Candidatus Woesearchaeota archaeon]|nr:nucleotidyltransferase domain-containing protein [Candidatus Woesearchaeota archaeon]